MRDLRARRARANSRPTANAPATATTNANTNATTAAYRIRQEEDWRQGVRECKHGSWQLVGMSGAFPGFAGRKEGMCASEAWRPPPHAGNANAHTQFNAPIPRLRQRLSPLSQPHVRGGGASGELRARGGESPWELRGCVASKAPVLRVWAAAES